MEAAWCWLLEERREEREEGRRGVVGRERERVLEGMVAEEDMFLFVSDGVCSCLRSPEPLAHRSTERAPRLSHEGASPCMATRCFRRMGRA